MRKVTYFFPKKMNFLFGNETFLGFQNMIKYNLKIIKYKNTIEYVRRNISMRILTVDNVKPIIMVHCTL